MGFSKKKSSPLQTLGDAHFATTEEVTTAGLLGEKGIRLGYYRDPESKGRDWGKVIRYSGDAHLITVAPTGSGKGRDVLVGALLEYEGSCIVIDPKGQLAAITRAQRERMGQKVIVLNPLPTELPMDLGPSAKYNPMAYLDPKSDAFGPSCEAIADSIVMHDDGPNSHFSDSARQLIAGIIMHLAAHGRDGEKNLVMMQRIVSGPIKALEGFIAEALASDKDGFITGMLARFASVGGEDRELRSIISTAITQCGFINNKAIGASLSASDFSFRDLKREAATVYLVLPAKFIQTCGKWFRLVLASAIAELWSDEKGKFPILAIIDEFKQLGRLAVVADAMGMARGFGLQLWPILQDLTQLKENYGDQWETFLGGAAVRQFFGPRENFTAEYVSKLCGVKTVIAEGQSVQHAREFLQRDQTGESWGQHAQPLLHPHNVSSLGPEESVVLGPQNIVIDAFRKPYFATEELADLASPDPYHKNDGARRKPVGTAINYPAPTDSFAAREAATAHEIKRSLAKKRPLPVRLLTWGSSSNPVLNVLRKVEYVLTLPLRLVAALVAAPFAIHNKPLAAVLGFLALFGFWEVFDGLAKGPIVQLYTQKVQEYQEEDINKNSRAAGNTMYSNYRAGKWLITEPLPRAVSFAIKGNASSHAPGIDAAVQRMSAVLDYYLAQSTRNYMSTSAGSMYRPHFFDIGQELVDPTLEKQPAKPAPLPKGGASTAHAHGDVSVSRPPEPQIADSFDNIEHSDAALVVSADGVRFSEVGAAGGLSWQIWLGSQNPDRVLRKSTILEPKMKGDLHSGAMTKAGVSYLYSAIANWDYPRRYTSKKVILIPAQDLRNRTLPITDKAVGDFLNSGIDPLETLGTTRPDFASPAPLKETSQIATIAKPKTTQPHGPKYAEGYLDADPSHDVQVRVSGVRYASVPIANFDPAQGIPTNADFSLTGASLELGIVLRPYMGGEGDTIHAGANIRDVGPAYLFFLPNADVRKRKVVLVPVADLSKTGPKETASASIPGKQ